MSGLTDSQLQVVRDEIGDGEPTDIELDDLFDRTGSVKGVILAVIKKRLATFAADAASLSVDGYSQNTSANITALQKQLERVQAEGVSENGEDDSGVYARMGGLVRGDRGR